MEANLDIDEDILREDYQTEEQARQGKEDLAAILRSMNDNMKMLGESMKRLHEPEPSPRPSPHQSSLLKFELRKA